MTISKATYFLESAYSILNNDFFENALSKNTIITIQSSPKAYGHFTTWEAWDKGKESAYEINIGAETLNRDICETIGTLIHEMTHQYCKEHGIKDTTRSGTYHNKNFKLEAEKRLLSISFDKKIGWSITQATPDLKKYIIEKKWKKIDIRRNYEFGSDTEKKKSSTRKYCCPCCGCSVRATKEVNIICEDCNEKMLLCD